MGNKPSQIPIVEEVLVQEMVQEVIPDPVSDPSAWIIDNPIAHVFLLHDFGVKFMFMLGYTFYAGVKVFKACEGKSTAYKLVMMIFASTGGGILVPIFVNGMPVVIANDAYPIAIGISFALHYYFPILRNILAHSKIMKTAITVMYEVTRAYVVVLFTSSSAKVIPASLFSFPVFGPMFCGAISGVGGAFMPLSKGLDPIKDGLDYKMLTAALGAACYHIFMSTSLSEGCIEAKDKAHFHLTMLFVSVALANLFELSPPKSVSQSKKED